MKHTAIIVVALGIAGACAAVFLHKLAKPDPLQAALMEMDSKISTIAGNLARTSDQQAKLAAAIESNAASFDRQRIAGERWSKIESDETRRATWATLRLTGILGRDDLRQINLRIHDLCEATQETEDAIEALRGVERLIAALSGARPTGVDTALAQRQIAEKLRAVEETSTVALTNIAAIKDLVADSKQSLEEQRWKIASLRAATPSQSTLDARESRASLDETANDIKVSLALLDQLDNSAGGLTFTIRSFRRAADA